MFTLAVFLLCLGTALPYLRQGVFVSVPERLVVIDFQVLFLVHRVLGFCLYLAGLLATKWRWQNLGWYMLGVGGIRGIPRKYAADMRRVVYVIEDCHDEEYHLGDGWKWAEFSTVDLYDSTGKRLEFDERDYYSEHQASWYKNVHDVHNAIGKFMARVQDGVLVIMDEYVFYPTCPRSDKHGKRCSCPDEWRSWSFAGEDFTINLPAPLYRLLKKLLGRMDAFPASRVDVYLSNVAQVGVQLANSSPQANVVLSFHDSLFAELGTPFWTVQEYKL